MKKQLLFIHGSGGYEEDKKLVESLERELGEYDIRYPAMPDEDSPTYNAWKGQIDKEISTMNGGGILVGHSFGASMLLKYLSEEKIERHFAGLFLIATPYWGTKDWQKEYTLEENFAARLPKHLRIVFYHDRDDEVIPVSHLALYKEKLPRATFLELDKGGHQLNNDLFKVARDIQEL